MIYDEPRFLPGGDTFMLVQFGDDARIDLNFMALGLTSALCEDRTAGVIDTNPSYNSVVVEYDPDRIGLDDLQQELRRLIEGLGSVEDLELESRLAYLPSCTAIPGPRPVSRTTPSVSHRATTTRNS